jgi:hypothetical protein
MAAQVADDVQAVLPTAGSVAYIVAKQLERLSAAEAREAAALLNLDRAKEWPSTALAVVSGSVGAST